MNGNILVLTLAGAALVLVIVELVVEKRDALAWAVLLLAIAVVVSRL